MHRFFILQRIHFNLIYPPYCFLETYLFNNFYIIALILFLDSPMGFSGHIHEAVRMEDEVGVQREIDRGCVNQKNIIEWTALHFVAVNGNLPIASMLLAAGADFNAQTVTGTSPLQLAAEQGQVDMAILLLNAGANWNTPNNEGKTAMQVATSEVKSAMLQWQQQQVLASPFHPVGNLPFHMSHSHTIWGPAWNSMSLTISPFCWALFYCCSQPGFRVPVEIALAILKLLKIGDMVQSTRRPAVARAHAASCPFGDGSGKECDCHHNHPPTRT
jgi:Ankyrin repeats (3 copies)